MDVLRKLRSRRGGFEEEDKGSRGRRKYTSGKERAITATAHARSMVRNPYLSRPAFNMKGIMRPAVPVPACSSFRNYARNATREVRLTHITPNANPFLRMNHSSRNRKVG